MMCPVFSNEHVCEESLESLASCLCNFFDKNVRIYSNVIVQNGFIDEYQPVAFGGIVKGFAYSFFVAQTDRC